MKANPILAYRFLCPLPALHLRTYLFTFPLGHSVPIPGFPACPQTKQEHLPQGLCTCYALCFESLSSPYLPSSPFYFTSLHSLLCRRGLPWPLYKRATSCPVLPIFLTPLYFSPWSLLPFHMLCIYLFVLSLSTRLNSKRSGSLFCPLLYPPCIHWCPA